MKPVDVYGRTVGIRITQKNLPRQERETIRSRGVRGCPCCATQQHGNYEFMRPSKKV